MHDERLEWLVSASPAGTPHRDARAPEAAAHASLGHTQSRAGGMEARPPRPPLRSLSRSALSESNVPDNGDDCVKPERSNSVRTESEALHAALLRHRTLELQAKLRSGSLLGTAAPAPASPADLLPLPSSLPGGVSRTPAAGTAAATRWAPPPSGTRGSAALTPEEELRGCICGGAGSNHRPRTYTVVDWFDTWGSQVRSALLHAGRVIWGGGNGSGHGGNDNAHADAAPSAAQQQGPPVLVPMVVLAR